MRRTVLLAGIFSLAVSVSPASAQGVGTPVTDLAATQRLVQGFYQVSNYIRGLGHLFQQTTDASNTSMALFQRKVRNAQIRDEHVPTPLACEAADNAQGIIVASEQAWVVRESIQRITDTRGEAAPGWAAYEGQGKAAESNTKAHWNRWCSEPEAREGLCRMSPMPNADQRASSLLGPLSYGADQERVNAAVHYTTTVTQNVPLQHPRGSQLQSMVGAQEIMTARRWYNGVMSMARWVLSDEASRRVETIVLTPAQREVARALGYSAPSGKGSLALALELDVMRGLTPTYAQGLEKAPPWARITDSVQTQRLQLYVQHETLKAIRTNNALTAVMLANEAEKKTGLQEWALRRMVTFPGVEMAGGQ